MESIYAYSPQVFFEIIVVDNGSDDNIEEELDARFPEVRFLETGFNDGFATANNLGIHNSHGDLILLLNSDTRIIDHTIQSLLDYLQFHPEVGIVGPRQISDDMKFVPSCGQFPTLISEMVRKIIYYRLSVDDYQLRGNIDAKHANMSRVDWVSGSCLMVRRKALQDAGLLDERFFMYFEDIDFCRRIQERGWMVQYFPSQTIIHYGGQSAKLNIMRVMVENRKSQLYFSRRYYGVLGAFLVRLFLLTKYSFNFVKWGIFLLWKKFLGRSRSEEIVARTMISKKVLQACLSSINIQPKIPYLQKRQAISSKNLLAESKTLASSDSV